MLVLVHKETSEPGALGGVLERLGYRVERRCPNAGDPLPNLRPLRERGEGFAGACILGGSMSATSDVDFPARRTELAWIERAIDAQMPLLGICLGAQLVALALGARVGPHPGGRIEVGYTQVAPTDRAGPFLDAPMHFYQWHREAFELPAGAEHLVRGEDFPHQAFRYRERVLGLQFHPEITRPMIERWTRSGARRLQEPGAQPREAQLQAHARHASTVRGWLERTLATLFGTHPTDGWG